MRIIVDGVFFQLHNSGIARVWQTILSLLAKVPNLTITLLDRGGAPELPGVTRFPFPAYKSEETAADSVLIQRVCDLFSADVFTSTYYTTPLTTPMVLMVYDMIPELFDFDLSLRDWMEKEMAIAFAHRFLCISHNTRRDLLNFYPEIPEHHARVAHCGVDTSVFMPRPTHEVKGFRKRLGFNRPYFLFVGARVQHKSYKNTDLFFRALKSMSNTDFDILCVGGEPEIQPQVLGSLPRGVRAERVTLSDYELSLAYGGATALVYPSLYEGFGMPVIEAMASGCPVITTYRGSLSEAAGDAALLVDGTSVPEMTGALSRIQDHSVQSKLRARGLAHAARFRWETMADLLLEQFYEVHEAARTSEAQAFFAEWRRLRQLQAEVDYL